MALPIPVADDYFDYLTRWYALRCDGEWEHEFGIRLETIDNPGWSLRIDLAGTAAEGRVLEGVRRDLEDGGWLMIQSNGELFEVSCDPLSLRRAVGEFKNFIDG